MNISTNNLSNQFKIQYVGKSLTRKDELLNIVVSQPNIKVSEIAEKMVVTPQYVYSLLKNPSLRYKVENDRGKCFVLNSLKSVNSTWHIHDLHFTTEEVILPPDFSISFTKLFSPEFWENRTLKPHNSTKYSYILACTKNPLSYIELTTFHKLYRSYCLQNSLNPNYYFTFIHLNKDYDHKLIHGNLTFTQYNKFYKTLIRGYNHNGSFRLEKQLTGNLSPEQVLSLMQDEEDKEILRKRLIDATEKIIKKDDIIRRYQNHLSIIRPNKVCSQNSK